MKLEELLRTKGNGKIARIKSDASIATAALTLTENNIGSLIVEADNGDIVGIISERDIVSGLGQHGADLSSIPVSKLMTLELIRCTPNDTVHEAMAMMTERRVRHLPVFEGDDLIGIVSIGDLVKSRISEIQAEAEAMRQYINS